MDLQKKSWKHEGQKLISTQSDFTDFLIILIDFSITTFDILYSN